MWLSKAIKQDNAENSVEYGSVTLSSGDTLEASSSVSVRATGAYLPYGYSSLPPIGEEVMLLPASDGQAVVGVKNSSTNLEAGEIEICSKGGARIVLKNDGSVIINSLKIDKEGKIVE